MYLVRAYPLVHSYLFVVACFKLKANIQNKWGTRITPTVQWPDKSFTMGLAQALAWKRSGLMVRPTIQFSVCPTFGGSNPGLQAELIHSVNEELSLICGCAFMSHPSAFASLSDQSNGVSSLANVKCKLLHWEGSNLVVAEGQIASRDPKAKVHHAILGPLCWKVWVNHVTVNVPLFRSTHEMYDLQDAIGSTVAWPSQFILLDEILD